MTTDPLIARALLAIQESQRLQRQSRELKAQFNREREELRLTVFQSAICRAEIKAYRDDRP
jgi:hypothetical protein